MLAYLSWHRAATGVEPSTYERALEHFHRSLAHRRPSGLQHSAAFRVPVLPWLSPPATERPGSGIASASGGSSDPGAAPGSGSGLDGVSGATPAYEDWYVLDDWAAVGVLEEAAVSRGHETAHHAVASLAGAATSSVYRLIEGCSRLDGGGGAVWVTRAAGHQNPSLAALLGDGMDPALGGLWRRCLGLGPAPEFCLLAREAPSGVAATRLPAGWSAMTLEREVVWDG